MSQDEDPSLVDVQGSKQKSPYWVRIKQQLGRMFGLRRNHTIEEEIVELIEEHDPEGTQVSSEEREILTNILSLNDQKVGDVMVPRTDIVALEDTSSLLDVKKVIIDCEHTRVPVYRESLDNVVGFLHIKDLIAFVGSKRKFNLKNLIREILYVPPSMKIIDLLIEMQQKRVHMALVLDEYGGTDGLVTLEDVIEEIVGEIEDEHDEVEEPELIPLDDGIFEASARLEVEDLEKRLGVDLTSDQDDDFETVGGLLFYMLGRIPKPNEVVSHPNGVEFTITEVDTRRIKKVMICYKAKKALSHVDMAH